MLERKGGNWLPFNAQLDLSTTKALISKSVINTKEIYFLEEMLCSTFSELLKESRSYVLAISTHLICLFFILRSRLYCMYSAPRWAQCSLYHYEKKLTKNIRPTDILQIYTSI